jgi:hypothetical protein
MIRAVVNFLKRIWQVLEAMSESSTPWDGLAERVKQLEAAPLEPKANDDANKSRTEP